MLERKEYYAVDMVFQSTASFIEMSVVFKPLFDLTRMNVQYSDFITKVLLDLKDEIWLKAELMLSRFEIKELKHFLRKFLRRIGHLVCTP